MKVEYWCCIGSGPEISQVYDTERDFGISDEEWNEMTQDDKEESLYDWATQYINYGVRDIK